MRRTRLAAIALSGTALMAGCLTAVNVSGVVGRGGSQAAAAATDLAFSHMVPVDAQRPGFEPDEQIDSQDRIYTSSPFGFSTTESFLWGSLDHGKSYQLTPGNIGPGKPTTCVGGGDTELALDKADNLFFSDLQGLTNLSNSVSTDQGTTWNTNCVAVTNTPVDRMWYAIQPGTKLGDSGFNIYEEYDESSANNILVESQSTDGLSFAPVLPNTP